MLAVGVICLPQGLLNSSINSSLTPVFFVLGAFGIFVALWPRLILSGDDVTVINLRPRTLRWGEIRGAEARSRWGTVNLVIQTGGGELRALAMRGSATGLADSRPQVEAVAADINEQVRRRAAMAGG